MRLCLDHKKLQTLLLYQVGGGSLGNPSSTLCHYRVVTRFQ